MIRSELILRIAEQSPHFYARDIEAAVDTLLGMMTAALARGDCLELCGFGMSEARPRTDRLRRNPRTQAEVNVAPAASPSQRGQQTFSLSGIAVGIGKFADL